VQLQLLAVLVVFAVVRNNLASPGSVRRLAVVVLANGAALAMFGLLQFFTAPRNQLYWSFDSQGGVFGPFVNRNHFACYINLCIGLGLGLVLGTGLFQGPLRQLGHRPAALWAGAALAVMLAASALCLSRGGLMALLVAGAVTLSLAVVRSAEFRRLGVGLLVVCGALALVGWLGFGAVESRLATVWKGDALRDDRWALWSRVLPLTADFPLWGAGFGTFDAIEPTCRQQQLPIDWSYEHAHNDYLELLLEGGIVGLLFALIAAAVVFWRAGLAYFRPREPGVRGLALGGIFALTTVAVHSLTDFSLHVPAVTLLTAVIAAQLAGLRDSDREGTAWSVRLHGVAPLAGAVAAVVVAYVLVTSCWQSDRAERYRLAALRASASPGGATRALTYWQAAAALVPDNVELQVGLADAWYQRYESSRGEAAAATVAACAHVPTPFHTALVLAPWPESDALPAALRQYVRARDLCPLLGKPHLRLGAHASQLARAEPTSAYLARAQRLRPSDDRVWYLRGTEALKAGRTDEAWAAFRHCLSLSDRHLLGVLSQTTPILGTKGTADSVLPDEPLLLLRAADVVDTKDPETGRPFLQRALRLLEARAGNLSDAELYGKARAHRALGEPTEALKAYEELLDRNGRQSAWRYEYATLLHEQGRFQDTRRELLAVLTDDPTHGDARELYHTVLRELADRP
jgi:O-antigen ligase